MALNWPPPVAPYPAAPDSLHGKASHLVLRSLCSPMNQVRLPPYSGGGRIGLSMLPCRIICGTLPTTKEGPLFHHLPGRLFGFIIMAPLHFQRAPTKAESRKRPQAPIPIPAPVSLQQLLFYGPGHSIFFVGGAAEAGCFFSYFIGVADGVGEACHF